LTLRPLGHRIVPSLMNSGIHIVMRRDGHLVGAADARREGAALGD
jgi:gamma-glutamyltranspeptidase / glutathione hydrolase